MSGTKEHADSEAEDEQIQNHLGRDEQSCVLTRGRDVPDTDRGEHCDSEVQGVDTGQSVRAEVREVVLRQHEVAGREQENEQRHGGGERFDGAHSRVGGQDDRTYLPNADAQ
ncbi:MAG TPA: hypothetical protein VIM10_07450 [Actinopolymorphaceae bacterium]